jgi:hypothetical protein
VTIIRCNVAGSCRPVADLFEGGKFLLLLLSSFSVRVVRWVFLLFVMVSVMWLLPVSLLRMLLMLLSFFVFSACFHSCCYFWSFYARAI